MFPSNMQRMLNKDLTRFKQSYFQVRQNRVSEAKALLAECTVGAKHCKTVIESSHGVNLCNQMNRLSHGIFQLFTWTSKGKSVDTTGAP